MSSIDELRCIINEELAKIKYPKDPSLLYNPIKYILDSKGKRIRSVITLVSYQLFKENIKEAIPAALAIEIFHNFTLLHDDIMDNALLRRGVATVHHKWNKNIAILAGDTMLIQAYQLLNKINNKVLQDVLQVFNKTAIKVCEGQQWDMDFETLDNISISKYIKMIEYKTASLLSASLKIGAIISETSSHNQKYLYQFGKNMGIAFQLKDDLLDTFGNPKKFGKKLGGDIISNKKTFLFLKALKISSEKQKSILIECYSSKMDAKKKIEIVKDIFNELDIYNHTMDLILLYHQKAVQNLNNVQSSKKELLFQFSNNLLERES